MTNYLDSLYNVINQKKSASMAENKYNHIYRDLRSRIDNGELKEGELLSEVKLSKHYKVARETLRRATGKLAEQGLLERFNGSGSRICSRHNYPWRFLVLSELNGPTTLSSNTLMPFLQKQADAMRIELQLCDLVQFCWLSPEHAWKTIRNMNISGIILLANHFNGDEPILKLLKGLEFPILLVFGTMMDYQLTGWPAIGLNIRQGWRMGLAHLQAAGHKKIITLTAPGNDIREYRPPEYYALLRFYGFSDDPRLIIHLKHDEAGFPEKLRRELAAPLASASPPTAIMCHSDFYAMDACRILLDMGLRIPQDVALVGFISGLNCNFMVPPLTSVEADFEELARQSLMLLRRAEQWFDPQRPELRPQYHFIKSQIIIRESSPLHYQPVNTKKEVQHACPSDPV